jgi:hypothetical protein
MKIFFFLFSSLPHNKNKKTPFSITKKIVKKKTLRLYQNQVPAITEILSKISQELEQKEKKAE